MKYISFVRFALIAISLIVVVMGLSSGDVNAMLLWAEGMLVATFAAVILLSAYATITNPQGAGRSLVGFLLVALVLGVSYAMADTTPIETPVRVFDDPSVLATADTGLFATYITAGLAIVSIFATEAYNLFKK